MAEDETLAAVIQLAPGAAEPSLRKLPVRSRRDRPALSLYPEDLTLGTGLRFALFGAECGSLRPGKRN